jgi:hypothetical protein
MDNAARTRQRVLALFLPIAAVLYISAEALSPKGTDQVIQTTATAFKVLAIAAKHPDSALRRRLACTSPSINARASYGEREAPLLYGIRVPLRHLTASTTEPLMTCYLARYDPRQGPRDSLAFTLLVPAALGPL